jgi:hypothetical protein
VQRSYAKPEPREAWSSQRLSPPVGPHLLGASSTLRELFGLWNFLVSIRFLLRQGKHLVALDNLGCVYILAE